MTTVFIVKVTYHNVYDLIIMSTSLLSCLLIIPSIIISSTYTVIKLSVYATTVSAGECRPNGLTELDKVI